MIDQTELTKVTTVSHPPFQPDDVFWGKCIIPSCLFSWMPRTCHPLQEHRRYQGELDGWAGSPATVAVSPVPYASCDTQLLCPPCREGDTSFCAAERRTIKPSYWVNLNYVRLRLIFPSVGFCCLCWSSSVHQPDSFIPDEFAVVTACPLGVSSAPHLVYSSKAISFTSATWEWSHLMTDAEFENLSLTKCWTFSEASAAVFVTHSL